MTESGDEACAAAEAAAATVFFFFFFCEPLRSGPAARPLLAALLTTLREELLTERTDDITREELLAERADDTTRLEEPGAMMTRSVCITHHLGWAPDGIASTMDGRHVSSLHRGERGALPSASWVFGSLHGVVLGWAGGLVPFS